eukprot:TRINITY_DN109743_c0_g1_i1.p1 TRINITY_DN109743_c0_g1~~TRINITY_DN109743_c0_g1_i1.p1  ORF type:complete len:514 (-),score=79.45 TRINITY_DN109743_c0_g1_i1:32-1573(-)
MPATPRAAGHEQQRFVVVEPVTRQSRSRLDQEVPVSAAGTRCPNCGNAYAPDAVFCRKCGAQRQAQGSLLAAWLAQKQQVSSSSSRNRGSLPNALSAELSRSDGGSAGGFQVALAAEGQGQVTYKVYTPRRRSLGAPQVYTPRQSLGARRSSSVVPASPTPPVIPVPSSFPAVRAVASMRGRTASPEPAFRSFSVEPAVRAAAAAPIRRNLLDTPELSDSRFVLVSPAAPFLRSPSALAVVPPPLSRSMTPVRQAPMPYAAPASPSVPVSACSTPPRAAWMSPGVGGMSRQQSSAGALGLPPLDAPFFWPPSPCKVAPGSPRQPDFSLQTNQIEFKFVKEDEPPLPPFPEAPPRRPQLPQDSQETVSQIPPNLVKIEEQVKALLAQQEALQQDLIRLKMNAKSNVESLEALRSQRQPPREAYQQHRPPPPAGLRAPGSPLQSQSPCRSSGCSGCRGREGDGAALAAARARGAAAAAEAMQPRVQQSRPSVTAAGWGCSPIDWLSCGKYQPSRT